jgi:hypothetical protein
MTMACALCAAEGPLHHAVSTAEKITVDKPLDWSGKIDGFIKIESSELVMHVDIKEIVGVYKHKMDIKSQTMVVLSSAYLDEKKNTLISVPENIMTFDRVLGFIDSVKKNRAK